MKSNRAGYITAVTMAGLAASLVLAGCGPQPGAAPAAAPTVAVTDATTSSTVLAASPLSTPATANSATSPAASPTSAGRAAPTHAPAAKPAPRRLKTFTFPDGHISFDYPGSWTVRTALPPAGPPGVEAVVSDGAGNDLLLLANGVPAGCAGGPVSRRVLDQAEVAGMAAPNGSGPVFGFSVESYGAGAGDAYFMGLVDPRSLKQGDGVPSWCNVVSTDNGGLVTRVLFDDPAFKNRGAAKAWMATEQYAQLKALLVSLNYH